MANIRSSHSKAFDLPADDASSSDRVQELERDIAALQNALQQRKAEIEGLKRSLSWRITYPLRALIFLLRQSVQQSRLALRTARYNSTQTLLSWAWVRKTLRILGRESEHLRYLQYLEAHKLSAEELSAMRHQAESWAYRPVISVVLPVYNPPLRWLVQCIDSVLNQAYPYWELCIADDCSSTPGLSELIDGYVARDNRIKATKRTSNGHISASTNTALQSASGEFVALLDHDDMLAPEALYEVAKLLNSDPSCDVIYSNEDKINHLNKLSEPTFKPQWSPEYFDSFMYIGHLTVYRRSLVEAVGGMRLGLEGSQDYDLALRVTERSSRIRHINKILYHWRRHEGSVAANPHSKPYAFTAAKLALNDACQRRGDLCRRVGDSGQIGIYCTTLEDLTRHNVVIASSIAKSAHTEQLCSSGVLLPNSVHAEPIVDLISLRKLAIESDADFILWLNDSAFEEAAHGWISALVTECSKNGVAMAAPKVIDTHSKTILHAGMSVFGKLATSNFYGLPDGSAGYGVRLYCAHDVSLVAPHCLMIKRQALLDIEPSPQTWQDRQAMVAELCFLFRQADLRIAWKPQAVLYGRAACFPAKVDLSNRPSDYRVLQERFQIDTLRDPYYPAGLAADGSFRIALEPH